MCAEQKREGRRHSRPSKLIDSRSTDRPSLRRSHLARPRSWPNPFQECPSRRRRGAGLRGGAGGGPQSSRAGCAPSASGCPGGGLGRPPGCWRARVRCTWRGGDAKNAAGRAGERGRSADAARPTLRCAESPLLLSSASNPKAAGIAGQSATIIRSTPATMLAQLHCRAHAGALAPPPQLLRAARRCSLAPGLLHVSALTSVKQRQAPRSCKRLQPCAAAATPPAVDDAPAAKAPLSPHHRRGGLSGLLHPFRDPAANGKLLALCTGGGGEVAGTCACTELPSTVATGIAARPPRLPPRLLLARIPYAAQALGSVATLMHETYLPVYLSDTLHLSHTKARGAPAGCTSFARRAGRRSACPAPRLLPACL